MERYGLPYKGSKNKLAERIVDLFPKKTNFYDLFCGGCAVTHRALVTGKFKKYVINDIDGGMPRLFADAVAGRYKDEKRWISRDDFSALKDTDPYVRVCWSFGDNGKSYLYSEKVEPWKKALHHARVFGDFSLLRSFGIETEDASRAWISAHHAECKEKYIAWYCREVMKSDVETERLRQHLRENITRGEDELRAYLLDGLRRAGKSSADVDRFLGTNGMAGHYFGRSQWKFPSRETYLKLQGFLCLPTPYDEIYGLQALMQSLQNLERLQNLESLQSLERLQRLQSLENLESLERLQRLQSLENLESLERLQRLESLESLESLERLEITAGDYRDVRIEPDSVVYCDIPYKGTDGYACGDFDHGAFYEWAAAQKELTLISSYEMPAGFKCIAEFKHRQTLCVSGRGDVTERVFIPESQMDLWLPLRYEMGAYVQGELF